MTSSSDSDCCDSSMNDKKGMKSTKNRKRKKHHRDCSDPETNDECIKRKQKKKLKKQKRKDAKELKKKKHKKDKKCERDEEGSTDIPLDLMDRDVSMAPMTKEQWEKQQSVIRKVYDETTGRHRLIKGDGEVIEEMVSRDRHKAINQQATKGDGNYFQSKLLS